MQTTQTSSRRAAVAMSILAVVAALSGCSKNSGYPVSGKITYEGEPLEAGGSIRFVPINGEGGKEAGGTIEKDGTYKLNTDIAPGKYRVEVYQNSVKEPAKYGDGEGDIISKEVPLPRGKKIPEVYKSADSPLKVTIEAKDNDIPLALTRQDSQRSPEPEDSGP